MIKDIIIHVWGERALRVENPARWPSTILASLPGLGRTAHNGALQAQARPPRCPLGPAIGEEVEALGECGALLS